MESQSKKSKPKAPATVKLLSLDEYLQFVENDKKVDFTINHLNQIIELHGFKKLHHVQKKVLVDAVNSIDLIDGTRSTLNDDKVNSRAIMTLPDAIKDLVDLKWQECCVTAMQTLNSVSYETEPDNTEEASKSVKRRGNLHAPGGVGGDNPGGGGGGNPEDTPATSTLTSLTTEPLSVDYSYSISKPKRQSKVRKLSNLKDFSHGDATDSDTASAATTEHTHTVAPTVGRPQRATKQPTYLDDYLVEETRI